jgi:hypothetical protein
MIFGSWTFNNGSFFSFSHPINPINFFFRRSDNQLSQWPKTGGPERLLGEQHLGPDGSARAVDHEKVEDFLPDTNSKVCFTACF